MSDPSNSWRLAKAAAAKLAASGDFLGVNAGLRMVSFDQDFERLELERCLILPSA